MYRLAAVMARGLTTRVAPLFKCPVAEAEAEVAPQSCLLRDRGRIKKRPVYRVPALIETAKIESLRIRAGLLRRPVRRITIFYPRKSEHKG